MTIGHITVILGYCAALIVIQAEKRRNEREKIYVFIYQKSKAFCNLTIIASSKKFIYYNYKECIRTNLCKNTVDNIIIVELNLLHKRKSR